MKPFILFTTDEEIGGLGATSFTEEVDIELSKMLQFIIEIDRRGCNQAVFYDCGNKEFKDYILSFGLKEEHGSFSDISILSPAYDIASVNLSAGYYNEHTKQEYINLDDLQNTIDIVIKILKDESNRKFYDFQEEYYQPIYDFPKYDESAEKNLMRSDYETLTDEEFYEYYGVNKPEKPEQLDDLIKTVFGY